MQRTHFLLPLALPVAVLLHGCANPSSTAGPGDCSGLSGSYQDTGEPNGDSLTQLLLRKKSSGNRVVQLGLGAETIRASSGTFTDSLTIDKDFNCSALNRIELTRQESSRIQLPPMIDQVKTVNYVLTGGPGKDLVLSTQVQTTISPYGAKLKGPVQIESTATWRRAGH